MVERGNFIVPGPTRRKRRQLELELRPHLAPLWHFACALAPRPEAADLVQMACLRAVERFDELRAGTDVRAWLFTVLRNEFVSRWRRERRRAALEQAEPAVVLPFGAPCPDLEATLIERRWSDEIHAALQSLPEPYRMPVYLKDVAGLAYREIAEVLDCPIGTVMSRLARGRASLRAALARQAQERGIVGPARRERAVR
jgi:RNA polymerase sigma-70 factor (ECF subfamily)